MQGLKVKCCNCGRTDFETTDKFNPDVTPNGSMVKCLLPYHIDWLTLSTTKAAEMTCPECCAQLAPSGRLTVLPRVQVNELGIVPRGDQLHIDGDKILLAKEKNIKFMPNVGKPAFICDVCGKELKTAGALTLHKRSHKQEVTNG